MDLSIFPQPPWSFSGDRGHSLLAGILHEEEVIEVVDVKILTEMTEETHFGARRMKFKMGIRGGNRHTFGWVSEETKRGELILEKVRDLA